MNTAKILAIDPGSAVSGGVLLDGDDVVDKFIVPNESLRLMVPEKCKAGEADHLAIEYTTPYPRKMADGTAYIPRQVMTTAIFLGRLTEAWVLAGGDEPKLVGRRATVRYITGSGATKGADARVRQALIEWYGGDKEHAIGFKKKPGPLYGLKSHMWPALAVALTYRAQLDPF